MMSAVWIIATDFSDVGAIGTIITTYDASGLLEKLGVDAQVIKSADMKDMGSYTRALTDEERELLQGLIDSLTSKFVERVAQGRGVPATTVQQWATGITYLGDEALEMGMIDQLGTYRDALDKALELGGVDKDADQSAVISLDEVTFDPTSLIFDLGL